jgi:hypothetical protein
MFWFTFPSANHSPGWNDGMPRSIPIAARPHAFLSSPPFLEGAYVS